jgi:hypothetical protein
MTTYPQALTVNAGDPRQESPSVGQILDRARGGAAGTEPLGGFDTLWIAVNPESVLLR